MNHRAIITHFERHLGKAILLPPEAKRIIVDPDIYAIPPNDSRTHWVLFTVSSSRASLDTTAPKEPPPHVALLMCLPGDWDPREGHPPHVLRYTAMRVELMEWPLDGYVVFSALAAESDSDHVFGLLIAPSRQLGEHSRIATGSGEETQVLGTYALTYGQYAEHQRKGLDVAGLPEVIERWRGMIW